MRRSTTRRKQNFISFLFLFLLVLLHFFALYIYTLRRAAASTTAASAAASFGLPFPAYIYTCMYYVYVEFLSHMHTHTERHTRTFFDVSSSFVSFFCCGFIYCYARAIFISFSSHDFSSQLYFVFTYFSSMVFRIFFCAICFSSLIQHLLSLSLLAFARLLHCENVFLSCCCCCCSSAAAAASATAAAAAGAADDNDNVDDGCDE